MGIGVIVGRFQTPDLHEGHLRFVDHVRELHDTVLIFIGVRAIDATTKDPLAYAMRASMLGDRYPEIATYPISDRESDERWSSDLDSKIIEAVGWEQRAKVTLYSSRLGFLPSYSGTFPAQEIPLNIGCSSTEIRAETGDNLLSSSAFRCGIIYGVVSRGPLTINMVDIAIVRDGHDVALGKRTHDDPKWRFPGGRVDHGETFEQAARRELHEETGLVSEGSFTMVSEHFVDDWRTRGYDDVLVRSLLFVTEYSMGHARGDDDLPIVDWHPINETLKHKIVPEHLPLLLSLISHLG